MTFEVTMKLGIRLLGNLNYLIYDEFDIKASLDMEIQEEVLIGAMETLSVSRAKLSDTGRSQPIYDEMNVTEE